jgi:hypothetical protein
MPYMSLSVEELELLEQTWDTRPVLRDPAGTLLRERLRSELAYQRSRDAEAETDSVRRRIGVATPVQAA